MKKILIWVTIVLVIAGIYLLTSQKSHRGGQAKSLKVESRKVETRIEQKEPKKEIFKFAIMADIHNDTANLDKALQQAAEDNLVVMAGDLTINGTQSEQEKIKKSLDGGGVKYYAIPGNHDDYKKIWIFGKKYQSIKNNNFKLILIDNSNWRGLGAEQKVWIRAEVAECLKIKCVAIMHMPLINNFSKHIMGEYNPETAVEAGWLKNILLNNGVKTGYSGHLHYSSSYVIEGWKTVLVGAISSERNTQAPRYTEVLVNDDGSLENEVKILN